jgi:hypothetical protein
MTVSVTASTENGVGQKTTLPVGRVSSSGPDVLRVATFNLYAPKNHPDDTYRRWGRELGSKADVLMLDEVLDLYHANLVANAAGLAYVQKMSNGDIAVASRTPLYNVQTRVIDVPGRLTSSDSHILSVQTNIDGVAHQFIAAHWSIRDGDADADQRPPHVSSPFRLQAARAMVGLMSSANIPIFAGGDFNAFSGVGPQDHDDNPNTPDFVGSTAEVDFMRTTFTDPFIALGAPAYCSNKRIDYVMMAGAPHYFPVSVESCPFAAMASPSDHPFVLTTFEAGDF